MTKPAPGCPGIDTSRVFQFQNNNTTTLARQPALAEPYRVMPPCPTKVSGESLRSSLDSSQEIGSQDLVHLASFKTWKSRGNISVCSLYLVCSLNSGLFTWYTHSNRSCVARLIRETEGARRGVPTSLLSVYPARDDQEGLTEFTNPHAYWAESSSNIIKP